MWNFGHLNETLVIVKDHRECALRKECAQERTGQIQTRSRRVRMRSQTGVAMRRHICFLICGTQFLASQPCMLIGSSNNPHKT